MFRAWRRKSIRAGVVGGLGPQKAWQREGAESLVKGRGQVSWLLPEDGQGQATLHSHSLTALPGQQGPRGC